MVEAKTQFLYGKALTFLGRPSVSRLALLPMRLLVGYGFVQHGFAKLARGPEAFAVILNGFGVPAPHITAWITIAVEIVGGLCVIASAFIPLVSLPILGF